MPQNLQIEAFLYISTTSQIFDIIASKLTIVSFYDGFNPQESENFFTQL